MLKFLSFTILIIMAIGCFSQEKGPNKFADTIPLFSGATKENNGEKIKVHFNSCGLKILEEGNPSYMIVSFLIDSIGNPTNSKLLFGNDTLMFNQVVSCMNNSPRWIPAKLDNKDVACWFNLAFSK